MSRTFEHSTWTKYTLLNSTNQRRTGLLTRVCNRVQLINDDDDEHYDQDNNNMDVVDGMCRRNNNSSSRVNHRPA